MNGFTLFLVSISIEGFHSKCLMWSGIIVHFNGLTYSFLCLFRAQISIIEEASVF